MDGKIVIANKKTCEVLGCEYDELIGKNWFECFVSNRITDDHRGYSGASEQLSNGLTDYYEGTIRLKNGSERTIAWKSTVIKDESGNTKIILAAGLDITKLKWTEDKSVKQLMLSKNLYLIAEKVASEKPNVRKRAQVLSKMCVEVLNASLAWVGYAASDEKSIKILAFYPEEHVYIKDLIVRWDDSIYAKGPVERSIKTSTYGVLVMYGDKYGFFNQERVDQIKIISHLAAAALENARLFEELEKKLARIEALHQVDRSITASTDLKLTLDIVQDQVVRQLGVDAADIFLFNEHSMTLERTVERGFKTQRVDQKPVRLGTGLTGKIGLDKKSIMINGNVYEVIDEFSDSYFEEFKSFVQREGFVSYAGVPLIAKGDLLGVLEIFNRSQIEESGEFLEFLQLFGQQAEIAIDSARMFEDLKRRNIELTDAYDATIEGWTYALDLRDKEREGHSERVTEFTLKMARKTGIKDEELIHIKRGVLLHDIGKMDVPDRILLKPGRLTDEEWEIMKKHPTYAFQMLSGIDYLRPAMDIPYCHHERWDGAGYPRGLKGMQIPLSARIFAVADVYDALTNDRPCRKAWSKEEAVEYIGNQSGTQFDPQVIDIFLTLVQEMKG